MKGIPRKKCNIKNHKTSKQHWWLKNRGDERRWILQLEKAVKWIPFQEGAISFQQAMKSLQKEFCPENMLASVQ